MSDAELAAKFRSLAEPVITAVIASRLERTINGLTAHQNGSRQLQELVLSPERLPESAPMSTTARRHGSPE